MLKRFVIENYRSCLRTSIDFHPNLSVLIGPNSSGKTNILQAIMLLNKLVQEDEYSPSHESAITVSSRIKAAFLIDRSHINLNASVEAYTDESNNDVMLDSQQKWLLKGQRVPMISLSIPLAFAMYHISGKKTLQYYRYRRRMLLHRWMKPPEISKGAMRILSNVAKYCAGIRYYGASQFTNPGSCPVSFEIEQEEDKHYRPFRLRGHARILYKMYSAQKIDTNQRYKQFMDIVGPNGLQLIDDLIFDEVKTSSSDYSVRVGGKVEVRQRDKLLVIPKFKLGKQMLSPNQLSEGTFKTLVLLFHVITEDSTALLIEEPEVCIHHGLLSSILEIVKSYSQNKQMILSTHSDYVLDHVSPENVYRVTFDKSLGTSVHLIRKTMTAKEYSALREYLEQDGNLGEYWREGGLGDRT